MNRSEISGLIILFVGVALLIFTFLNAYWFLVRDVGLISTGDLVETFGKALAPLIATCIRIMYLGIMGWIGSLLTLRGISLLKHKEPAQPIKIEKKSQKTPTASVKNAEKTPKPPSEANPPKVEAPTKPAPTTETKHPDSSTQENQKTVKQPEPAIEEKKEEKPPENVTAHQETSRQEILNS